MPQTKLNMPFHAFMVLFTIFAVPLIIFLPFLLAGFVGRL
jgi:hypothetical protein